MRRRGTFPQHFLSGSAAISLNVIFLTACTMSGEQAIHDAVDQESMVRADIVAENETPARDRELFRPPPPPPPPVAQLGEQVFGGVADVLITGSMAAAAPSSYGYYENAQNTERYPDADPNPVKIAAREPVSTFSVDVDTTSYSNMRRFLEDGVF
jgi:hypothetical protein